MVVCDKCQGPTTPKQITSKKTGKQYTVYQCTSGCMNGRFAYSCFAPKVAGQSGGGATAPAASIGVLQDIAHELSEIKSIMLLMNSKMPAKVLSKQAEKMGSDDTVASDELNDSEEIPF
jgi:hypothetical protein